MNGESIDRPFDIDDNTRKGLWFMIIVFIVLAFLPAVIIGFLSLFPSNYYTFLCLGFLFLIYMGIIFICIGMLIIGIYKIYKGSEYISFTHVRNVKITIGLILSGIILSAFVVPLSISSYSTSYLVFTTNTLFVISPFILIYELTNKKIKVILSVGISCLLIYYALINFYDYNTMIENILSFDSLFSYIFALLFVGLVLLAYGYLKTIGYSEGSIYYSREDTLPEESVFEQNTFKDYIGKPGMKQCYRCREIAVDIYEDGSGICQHCGHSYMDYRSPGNSVE